jgi:hypothetical protein
MRLRIASALATGAVLIGLMAWPLAAPPEPSAVVSVAADSIGVAGATGLAFLAFASGFIAYFLCWPYGREIGILAAPAGLAVWASRSGSMADLLRQNPALEQREALFVALKWEPLFWLAIVAAGFAGVLAGQRLRSKNEPGEKREKAAPKWNVRINAAIAVLFSVLLAQLCIRILAQDVKIPDRELGLVAAQPATAQIAFAVSVSFGLAGFVAKKLLNSGYIWPTIGSAFVNFVAITTYARQNLLQLLVQRYPAVFFSNVAVSILPVQMVAFGALGSIAGYWLAIRYNYWRKHA